MPRLALVVLLLVTPPEAEAPRGLPAGLHATRVSGGVVQLQAPDGAPIPGETTVGPGWYFDAQGYEALYQGRAELEERYKVVRAQLEAYQQVVSSLEAQLQRALTKADGCGPLAAATCAAAAANASGYSLQVVYLVALLCVGLGMALGLLVALLIRLRPPPEKLG